MMITWYKRCLCITELTGIGVDLPSSELELNSLLKGFCTGVGIELEFGKVTIDRRLPADVHRF